MEMKAEEFAKREAFEKVYRDYFASIYNYIFFRVGNHTDAEDLTADVFLRAYEYMDSFDNNKGVMRAWLGGIARNRVNTHLRKKMVRPHTVELSVLTEPLRADVSIEEEYQQKETTDALLSQIRKLPKQQQEFLTLKYFLGITNRDIAKALDMSESNVGVTLYRINEKLRKELSDIV